MTFDRFLEMGSAAAIILSFALNLYLFQRARSDHRFDRINERTDRIAKALQDEINERREQSGKMERDHAVLAATVAGLPTHDDLSDIREELSTLARTLASVNQRSETTLNSVQRIESYLLERRP